MSQAIIVQQITGGKWKANCYVIHKTHRHAVIIDPGGDPEGILEYIENEQLRVLAILATHGHHDHIDAAGILKTRFSIPFYLHSADVKLLKYAHLYRKLFDGHDGIVVPDVDYYLDKIETPIQLGDLSIDVLFTPGHTRGGVCLLIGNFLFTGDTLLRGRVGRVDLPESDRASMVNSLQNLGMFPSGIGVYPGHGKTSTLLEEKQGNAEFRKAIEGSATLGAVS